MIGLDTNVLVRFLVEDDAGQAARAKNVVQHAIERDERLFVSDVVMCELAWVLERAYGLGRAELTETLRALLSAKHLTMGNADVLARALAAHGSGRGGFPDYVIRETARGAGCQTVATFDKALLREPGFERP